MERLHDYVLYIMMFPQLIAGPIVRYCDIEQEIRHRNYDWNEALQGFYRFIIGLSKKILISDVIGIQVDKMLAGDIAMMDSATAWITIIGYTMQLYFDFSGYSDMAIGLGKMMGFHFPENFDYPYISRSITEFWRRWHMSLGSWFRSYVYIPLGGNRQGLKKQIRNIAVVWLLTGIWHGASWNFLLWGVYFGVFLILEKFLWLDFLKKHQIFGGFGAVLFGIGSFVYCVDVVAAIVAVIQCGKNKKISCISSQHTI